MAAANVAGDGLSPKEHEEKLSLARQAAGCFLRYGYPAKATDDRSVPRW